MYRTCLTHLIVLVKWFLTRKKSGEVTRSIPKKNPLGRTFSSAAKIKQLFLELDWWYANPSEKYESQFGLLFKIYGKIKKTSKPPTRNDLRYLRPILEISYAHRHVLGIC